MKMRPIDRDETSPTFWDRDNWIILELDRPVHTCTLIPAREISSNQFINLIRGSFKESGITDFKQIRQMSRIDESLAQEASVYLKDNKHYHEVIRKLRKKNTVMLIILMLCKIHIIKIFYIFLLVFSQEFQKLTLFFRKKYQS